MRRYTIVIPIAGTVSMVIDANSEEEALKKAITEDLTKDDMYTLEWERFEQIVQGNCLNAPQNEIEIVEVEEIEEDV